MHAAACIRIEGGPLVHHASIIPDDQIADLPESADLLAEDAGTGEPSPRRNSLLTGKNTGNFIKNRLQQ
jgi:hypothetical protein